MIKKFMAFSLIKKIIFILMALAIIGLLIVVFRNGTNNEETITVRVGDFVNQISISGKVIPSENVLLAFKNSGRVENIFSRVDEKVPARTLIAKIDATDAEKRVHDAEIALESAKLSLEKLKIQNSDENLNANLQKAYDDGFIAVSDAFIDITPTLTGLDNLLNQEIISDNAARIAGSTAVLYRSQAEGLYYKAKNLFNKNRDTFRLLDRNSSKSDIENIIDETYNTTRVTMDAVKSVKNLTDYLADDTGRHSEFTSSQDTLYEYTNTINAHLTTLLNIKNNIKNYKDAFSDTDIDTKTLSLSIKQKENDLQDARNKLEDYYIRAPFPGIITKIDAKIGEMATSNAPLVSMMSAGTFQIESFVPEVSISKIKIGDEAQVTLDAYGENVPFLAKVIFMDPAETIRGGVSTYKIKLQFENTDERIKSGMTANVSIIIFKKPNTITVPEGVIYEKNGKNFVQIKKDKKTTEREVTVGIKSSLGQVEILSGIQEGETVVLKPAIN